MSVFQIGSPMGSLLKFREGLSTQPKIERAPELSAELDSVIEQILQLDLSPSLPLVEKKDLSEVFPNPKSHDVHPSLKKKREETKVDAPSQEAKKKRTYAVSCEERIEFHPIKNSLKRMAEESSGVSREAKKRRFDTSSSEERIEFHPIKNPLKRMMEESNAAPAYKKNKMDA